MDKDGAVRSIQAAHVTVPAAELERLWSNENLERLARTYWKYLSRVTLGLIRVTYTEDERAVVLLFRPLVLLRFRAPEYEFARRTAGSCAGGSRTACSSPRAAAAAGATSRSTSAACRRRRTGWSTVHVEVEVASFYPAIATWLTKFVYSHTQSKIHVLVTHGFLRSLARLELEESAVGRFAEQRRGVRQEKDGADHRRRDAVGLDRRDRAPRRAPPPARLAAWLPAPRLAAGVAGQRPQLVAVVDAT